MLPTRGLKRIVRKSWESLFDGNFARLVRKRAVSVVAQDDGYLGAGGEYLAKDAQTWPS